MTVMITGGTGFVGSHLARHLVKSRGAAKVVLFDVNPNYARVADLQQHAVIVHGDLQEPMELLNAMRANNVDVVVHLAYSIGALANANPPRFVKVNAVGTTNVFEASRIQGVKRVVYASSLGVYPTSKAMESKPATEDEFPTPNTIYGACKVLNEVEAEVYRTQFGLDTIGIRLPMVFGHERLSRKLGTSYMWGDVPGMATLGQPAELPPLNQLIDWVHVEDAAEAFALALEVKNPAHRLFNLSGGNIRAAEWHAAIRKAVPDAKVAISAAPHEVGRPMSNRRIMADLGFRPRYTAERAIGEYVKAVRSGTAKP